MSDAETLRKLQPDEVGFDPEEGPYDSGVLDSLPSFGAPRRPLGGDEEKRGEGPEQERVDSAYGSSSITDSLLESCAAEEQRARAEEQRALAEEQREAEEQRTQAEPGEAEPAPDGEGTLRALQALGYLTEDGDTLLHLAVIHESLDVAMDIISLLPIEMAEVQNDLFQTPLHLAVYLDQMEVARALVLKGVNLELQDRNGNTALHVACEQEHLDCARVLLQEDGSPESRQSTQHRRRQDLQLQNWQGLACLHIATLKKNDLLISLLLKRNADINVKDGTSGKTPLHFAVELRDRALVSSLLRQGAQVDAAMYNGCTPLHLAVGRKDAAIASVLCQSGADTLLRNMEDETAQDLADGNNDLLALLPFDDLKISGKPVVCSE